MSKLKKSKELKVSKRFGETSRKWKPQLAYCSAWIPNFLHSNKERSTVNS